MRRRVAIVAIALLLGSSMSAFACALGFSGIVTPGGTCSMSGSGYSAHPGCSDDTVVRRGNPCNYSVPQGYQSCGDLPDTSYYTWAPNHPGYYGTGYCGTANDCTKSFAGNVHNVINSSTQCPVYGTPGP